MTALPRILLVDDEIRVLTALARQLHKHYDVTTAVSGQDALVKLAEGTFVIIMSDMRMPGMSGAELLQRSRQVAPDTVRLLLTGHSDLDAAVSAINNGGIFRFLCKPCSTELLASALTAALEQHRLVTAERELLEQTLRGAVAALVETLSLTQPLAFGTAMRLKHWVRMVTQRLCPKDSWPIEVAAMVSQLGAVAIPLATLERWRGGQELSTEERAMIDRIPHLTTALIGHIPRLEPVRELLSEARNAKVTRPLLGARILRAVEEFEVLETTSMGRLEAIALLRSRGTHDPVVLEALEDAVVGVHEEVPVLRELREEELVVGMLLWADVVAKNGMLLIPRGQHLTVSMIELIANFRRIGVRQPIIVRE